MLNYLPSSAVENHAVIKNNLKKSYRRYQNKQKTEQTKFRGGTWNLSILH